jgi:hypothetical protein
MHPGTRSPAHCAKALVMWQRAIAASEPVWPSPLWPERRPLLLGAAAAARACGDGDAADKFSTELAVIDTALGF